MPKKNRGGINHPRKERDLYEGLYVEGSPGQYQKEADDIVRGTRDALRDFGFEDALTGVYFGKARGMRAAATMNGVGRLTIVPTYLAAGEGKDRGVVVDTYYATGAHEAGHAIVNELLKRRVMTGQSNLERATARHLGKLEHEILKEAKRRYGSNPRISQYGSKNEIEKVAEAVCDVWGNKTGANPYSKVIYQVMKDINNGTFKPKIKVTRAQMGL